MLLNREEVYFSGGFSQTMNSSIITTGNELIKKEYEESNGVVYVETLCNPHFVLAKSYEEFIMIPVDKLERMIYSAEMSVAR